MNVLVIGPHPDDQELGMGGTIARLASQGHNVLLLDMTNGEPTPHGSVETRAKESAAAAKVLGVERTLVGLPNRQVQNTIEARHKVAAVIRQHKADWLFVPYPIDAHPDHTAATRLVEDARFWAKLSKTDLPGEPHHPERIYNYYCVHLKLAPQPALVLDISAEWDQKLAAIRSYESQFITGRSTEPPVFLDALRDEAAYWGKTIGTLYGEPFTCREPIGLSSMSGLI